jgi:hypothetical protein
MSNSSEKNDKIKPNEAEVGLKLLLLQKTALLNKLKAIRESNIPEEDKFQKLSELINPIGGSVDENSKR